MPPQVGELGGHIFDDKDTQRIWAERLLEFLK